MTSTSFRALLRMAVLPLVAATVVSLSAPTAASSGRDDQAADIVATAPAGQPLEVVVTSRGSDGVLRVTTTLVKTKTMALELILQALHLSSTIGAEMNTSVSIDSSTYNDSLRSQQWALTALKAETVQKTSKGSGVTVAVLDTGVQASHVDLSGSVLAGTDVISPGTSATDENGHGTAVAGIIAATYNNKKGIAGLAPQVKILPVRILDANGSGTSADVAKGILYAASNGARVINLSLGSTVHTTAMEAAVAEAIKKNVLVVAAGGNRGCDATGSSPTEYPASYAGVVGVGAVDKSLKKASFSSCGSWVDLSAPGASVITTMMRNSVGLGCGATSDYCTLNGTSFATPYVAAAAALAIAKRGWSQTTVANKLLTSATDLSTPGKDKTTGAGFLNPVKLVAK
ncbi:S8 family serine peptidase [Aeromicrobium sp.]|uniref:S8 family serine peptidase n=1 Tax=Aeromicrobium sp. TaxID=1871063 RepID=UPI003C53E36B